MSYIFCAIIKFYKKIISPLLPHVCIYTPSCSSYCLDAIKKYGAFKGAWLGFLRLMRCAPWGKGGFDPVKDNPKKQLKWLL